MRPLHVPERLDRIEERMATRDDIAGLRSEILRTRRSPLRRLWRTALWSAAASVVLALAVPVADRLGVAP